MTETTPLTDDRLAEIQDILPQNDGYGPPWEIHHEMIDGYWLVHYDTDNPQAGLVAMVPDCGFRLAVFIAEAVTAVPDLLAEVRRLRAVEAAIVARVREQVAREIEDGIPTWEGMGERARDRNDMLRIAARIARAGQPPKEQR